MRPFWPQYLIAIAASLWSIDRDAARSCQEMGGISVKNDRSHAIESREQSSRTGRRRIRLLIPGV